MSVQIVWHAALPGNSAQDLTRFHIAEWLRENGVNPDVVSCAHDVIVRDGEVHFTELLLDERGGKYIDRETDAAAQKESSHPITVPYGK